MKLKKYLKLLYIISVGLFGSTLIFSQTTNNSRPVYLRAAITDQDGSYVGGLQKENLRVIENGIEQEITEMKIDSAPASVLILMDVSDSVDKRTRQLNAKYALKFMRGANAENEYSIIAFDRRITELADWTSSDAELSEALDEIANLKVARGNTVFNDAVLSGLEKLKTAKNEQKILLVFSDGQENSSNEGFNRVAKELKKSDATFFSIANLASTDLSELVQSRTVLDKLGQLSGGKAFYLYNEKEFSEAVEMIGMDSQSRYLIGYVPKPRDGKRDWQSVEIKVSLTDTKNEKIKTRVRMREGYFTKSQ